MIPKLVAFGAGLAVLWGILCVPAYFFAGTDGVIGNTVAAAICGLPAIATLSFSLWASRQGANLQLVGLVGGMVVRMGFALGVGTAVHKLVEGFTLRSFLIWLVAFYFATLLAEVGLVVRGLRQN